MELITVRHFINILGQLRSSSLIWNKDGAVYKMTSVAIFTNIEKINILKVAIKMLGAKLQDFASFRKVSLILGQLNFIK